MSLLKAPIVKNSHSFGPIYIIFLKQRPEPDLKVFQYRIGRIGKDRKSIYRVREKFSTFCNLVNLILD